MGLEEIIPSIALILILILILPSFIKLNFKKKIFFKSNKFLIHEGKAYPNKMSVAVNQSISSFDHPFCQIIDHRDFWEDKEHFYFVEKK